MSRSTLARTGSVRAVEDGDGVIFCASLWKGRGWRPRGWRPGRPGQRRRGAPTSGSSTQKPRSVRRTVVQPGLWTTSREVSLQRPPTSQAGVARRNRAEPMTSGRLLVGFHAGNGDSAQGVCSRPRCSVSVQRRDQRERGVARVGRGLTAVLSPLQKSTHGCTARVVLRVCTCSWGAHIANDAAATFVE